MSVIEEIFVDVSPLNSTDKIELVDKILTSLNPIDNSMEAIWSKEIEERVEAYDRGLLSSVSSSDVFAKYHR
jgi:hypothetical protein